ncbi:MAG: hypothetical protein KGJ84_14990 [Elusimicrobia bacterium]|nr:hypothetical protein [Elusimicrobiota bacterium]
MATLPCPCAAPGALNAFADLAGDERVGAAHLAEALQYRALDRLRAVLEEQR